ncbi:unnamed protein product [Diamesa serratosioi]
MAVPISSSIVQATRKPLRTRNAGITTNNHRGGRNGERVKMNLLFSEEDSIIWQNSCMGNFTGQPKEKHEFEEQVNNLKLSVGSIHGIFQTKHWKKIDIDDIQDWEKFHSKNYTFLPTRPTPYSQKWHTDTQIFVASFMYIHKIQLGIDEDLNENNDLSNELRDIMERARHLLCDIEFYVNATAEHKIDRPKILTIQEMSDILRFPKRSTETQADQIRVHSKFVKKRFESYITILFKRLKRPVGSLKAETKNGGKKRKCDNKMGTKEQNALRKPNFSRRKLRKNEVSIPSEPKTTPKMQHLNSKKNNFIINQKFMQQTGVTGGGQLNKQIVQNKIRRVNKSNNNDKINQTTQNKRRKMKLERLRNRDRNFPRHQKNLNNIPVTTTTTTTQSPLLN